MLATSQPCGCDEGANPPHTCDRHTIDLLQQQLSMARLRHMMHPIDTAPRGLPTDEKRSYVLLFGDSGYIGTPFRCSVGYWCHDKGRWLTHSNDDFTEDGPEPTHWAPLLDEWPLT